MCNSWPGQTARMCVLEGQGEGASRARACLHDVVSSSSARFVIFLLPSLSCPSPPTRGRGRTSEPPSVRPSVRSPLPLLAASREFRITPNVRSSVRPCACARPSVRGTTGRPRWKWWRRAGAPTLATSSVRLHVVWLRRHHFVFSVVHRCRRCAIAQGAPPRSRPNMCGTIILMTQSSLVASKKLG